MAMKRAGLNASRYPLPIATDLDRPTIQEIGSRAAEALGAAAAEGQPHLALQQMVEIIQRLGGKINRIGFGELTARETRVGSIEIHREGDFDIFLLNEEEIGPISTRETLAHELGHYVLHHPLSDSGKLRANHLGDGSAAQAEKEATWFAEGFLVPSSALKKALRKTKDQVRLARQFCVSQATLHNRARVTTAAEYEPAR